MEASEGSGGGGEAHIIGILSWIYAHRHMFIKGVEVEMVFSLASQSEGSGPDQLSTWGRVAGDSEQFGVTDRSGSAWCQCPLSHLNPISVAPIGSRHDSRGVPGAWPAWPR